MRRGLRFMRSIRLGDSTTPIVALALIAAAAALFAPSLFTPGNLFNVGRQASFLAVVALGQLLVVIVGGLDLSVGAVITTTLLLVTFVAGQQDGSLVIGLLVVLGTGLSVGLANAALVIWRGVPAILATLSTMVLLNGLVLWVTQGSSRGTVPPGLRPLGSGAVASIPIPLVIAAVVSVLVGFMLRRTVLGRSLYATGANAAASHLSGVPVRWVTASAFVLSSLLAVLAGLMLTGFVGFIDRSIGVGYDLDSITAVVLGGAALAGGRGSVPGVLAAAVALAALGNLLLLLNADVSIQLFVKALVLGLAVLASRFPMRVSLEAPMKAA